MREKARTLEEARALRARLDAAGKRVVFTTGCFDILHAGHVRYLAEAQALGDALVVGLNSDASVRALKGAGRPINHEADRAEVMAALESVDGVVVFDGVRSTAVIEALQPHVYAKGGDYTVESLNPEERGALEAAGTEIHILSLVAGKSTTATLAKMGTDGQRKPRIGVLGSGKGSNFDAICRAIERGTLNAEVALVISDVEEAPILAGARSRGIDAVFVDPGDHPNRLADPAQKEIADRLKAAACSIVALAGFMRVIKAPVLQAFPGKVLNIHPSLLPKHKGRDAWVKALEAGDVEAGCTVHTVTAEIDAGEILEQRRVPVLPDDTAESLFARIQEAEHEAYPTALAKVLAAIG